MRLDGRITHGMVMDVESVGADNISFVFGPVGSFVDTTKYYTKEEIDAMLANVGVQSDWNVTDSSSKAYIKHKPTIPAAQVQSDWNEASTSSKAYIQNKPTIPTVPTNVSAFTNDAGYLNNNFCPIIEDTRSSAVAAITGVAPFGTNGTIPAGQRIIIHFKYNTANGSTLTLTLSDETTTSAIPLKASYHNSGNYNVDSDLKCNAGSYMPFIYDATNSVWHSLGDIDYFKVPLSMSAAFIQEGTSTTGFIISPKLCHDSAYIVEETYSSGSLKANKMYDFGTVSSALTIPSLDVTNDLVSNALNFYALRFIAGADNLSITFPTGVLVDDTPTINTGDYVEIMINLYVENNTNHFYASIKVWQAQQQNS